MGWDEVKENKEEEVSVPRTRGEYEVLMNAITEWPGGKTGEDERDTGISHTKGEMEYNYRPD